MDITPVLVEAVKESKELQDAIKSIGGSADPNAILAELKANKDFESHIIAIMEKEGIHPDENFCDDVLAIVSKKFASKVDTAAIAAALVDQLTAMADDEKKKKVIMSAKKIAAKSGKGSLIFRNCEKFCRPGQELGEGKWFVIFKGPPGASKTFSVTQWANTAGFDLVIKVGCMADMEARDFIAGPGIGADGNFKWINGPLAQAFILAAAGKSVCIILDEIGNVPRKAKQAFQTATSPDADGNLTLDTGEPVEEDGIMVTRKITAPMSNISIIGTQNSGTKFDCEPDTPAIRARFKPFYTDTSVNLIKDVIGPVVKTRGWTDHITTCFINLWKAGVDAEKKHLLENSPSIREFTHLISLVHEPKESEAKKQLKDELLADGFNTWFVAEDHDGLPMTEQVKAWESIVNKSF